MKKGIIYSLFILMLSFGEVRAAENLLMVNENEI